MSTMTLTKDSFTINPTGYLCYKGVPAHRVIASLMLDRLLRPGEVVHHKNGNKLDCRPQNLAVMKSSEHHPHLAPHNVDQVIALPSPDWLAKLKDWSPNYTRTTIVMPTKLWLKAKIEVLREGTTLQAKIQELIENWLDSKHGNNI